MTFDALGLSPDLLRALQSAHLTSPTPVQSQAIPPALAGKDVVACAPTGTGKTLAYLLPVVQRLAGKKGGPRVLVLGPTRELVAQVAEEARWVAGVRGLAVAEIVGGAKHGAQRDALQKKPDVVVATPGRLVDFLRVGEARLDRVEVLVLDEADRMLDMGFLPQLREILEHVPRARQTLLYSATLGRDVEDFCRTALARPSRVAVAPSGTAARGVRQHLYRVKLEEKFPLLLTLLAEEEGRVLVFARSRERADKVLRNVQRGAERAAVLHSDRTQSQRKQALDAFRDGRLRVLVATDLAARGLDVEAVEHVINFDLPQNPEDYVHRIGRTARAGATGTASTFVTDKELDEVARIEKVLGARVPLSDVPRDSARFREELEAFLARQKEPGEPGLRGARRPDEARRQGPRWGRPERPLDHAADTARPARRGGGATRGERFASGGGGGTRGERFASGGGGGTRGERLASGGGERRGGGAGFGGAEGGGARRGGPSRGHAPAHGRRDEAGRGPERPRHTEARGGRGPERRHEDVRGGRGSERPRHAEARGGRGSERPRREGAGRPGGPGRRAGPGGGAPRGGGRTGRTPRGGGRRF